MKKHLYILPVLGLVFGLSLFFIAARIDGRVPDGLCGALMGIGGALTGLSAVGLVKALWDRSRTPEQRREAELGEKDERNVSIREKAAMDSWYGTLLLLCVLWVVTLFLNPDGIFMALAAAAIVLHCVLYLVNLGRWNKKL